jgi:acetate---CoA ligase (ADP-forming)
VLVCTLSHSDAVTAFRRHLQRAKVPVYTMPETAVDALESLCRVGELRRIDAGPEPEDRFDREAARAVIEAAQRAGRESLGFEEGAAVLSTYGIPVCRFAAVHEAQDAIAFADEVGYPVVAKVDAPGLYHRFERGAVLTGIGGPQELRRAVERLEQLVAEEGWRDARVLVQPTLSGRELILGMNRDPAFGPVLMFGVGGTFVEALKDVSFGLAPLSLSQARRMIGAIRAFPLLQAFRGHPAVDLDALSATLHALGALALDHPAIQEIDLNPYMVGADAAAVDILVKL